MRQASHMVDVIYIITFLRSNIVILDELEFIIDYFNQSGNRKKIMMTEELFFKVEKLCINVEKLKM